MSPAVADDDPHAGPADPPTATDRCRSTRSITGRIATLAGDTGFGWVEAIGIRDGRIAFAGSEVDLETRADPHTRRIALEPDAVAIPGLTDAHLHLAQAARALAQVDLSGAATLDDGHGGRRPPPTSGSPTTPDAWIDGHGWDPDRWGRWPTADDLERVAPGRRVVAVGARPSRALASHAALRTGGVTADTAGSRRRRHPPDADGDARGRPPRGRGPARDGPRPAAGPGGPRGGDRHGRAASWSRSGSWPATTRARSRRTRT